MKFLLITLLFVFFSLANYAQSFEGEVIYHTVCQSKIPNLTTEQLTKLAGDTCKYYMKGGNYRSDLNGTYYQWQIYINQDNRMYNKFSNSGTILWNDGAVNKDTIYKVQLNKNVTTVLGYMCDELIFNCKSGIETYYFSSKFPIDSKLYAKQLYQNWYDYLKIAKAMPLKMVIVNNQINVTMTAVTITPMKIDDSMFILPEGVETMKNPKDNQ
jgi:hypothetical protein